MNEIILENIVLDLQFIIGLFGLIGGNLTAYRDFPIKGTQARIVGAIFLLPLLSTLPKFFHWSDLLPAIIGVGLALAYLFWIAKASNPKVYQFWFVAMIPAVSRYTATFLLHGVLIAYVQIYAFEILLPVIVAFVATLALPVVENKTTAFLFAMPTLVVHIHYAILNWFLPYTWALQNPNGPFTRGIIIYFIIDSVVGLVLFVVIAVMARLGSSTNRGWPTTENRPT